VQLRTALGQPRHRLVLYVIASLEVDHLEGVAVLSKNRDGLVTDLRAACRVERLQLGAPFSQRFHASLGDVLAPRYVDVGELGTALRQSLE